MRLRDLPDIRQALGAPYFEQVSDSTRGRWLRSIAEVHVSAELGKRLQSVLADAVSLRNQLAHAPSNFHVDPADIRVSSSKWMNAAPVEDSQIDAQYARLLWVESWSVWLLSKYTVAKQERDGAWHDYEPPEPSRTPPH